MEFYFILQFLYVFDFVCLFNLFKLMHIYLTIYVPHWERMTNTFCRYIVFYFFYLLIAFARFFKKISFPLSDKWTPSHLNSSLLFCVISLLSINTPPVSAMYCAMALLMNFLALFIFGPSPHRHTHLSVMPEKITVALVIVCSAETSSFMELRRSRLLSRPRSFPPAWITRTSGLSPDERTAGRSWLHLIPPFPSHCTLVLCRPRLGSQEASALLSAHFTKLWPTINTTFSEIFEENLLIYWQQTDKYVMFKTTTYLVSWSQLLLNP